ncbi:MAG: rhomboid family intramembrane serine protease [Polyangiaceae bacterium]|nr:rhomboid family intramembrane serine protease [Polyangiaceae bacterium]
MLPIRDFVPSRTVPFITWALVGVNVLFWLGQVALGQLGVQHVVLSWGLVPGRLLADPPGEAVTVLTSMFLHGDWAHIIGNMVFLVIFGDNVEDALGHARFLVFYVLAGVAAAAAQVGIDPSSAIPMVGASGAIAGVLGAYLVLHPRANIAVLNPILPLWLWLGPIFTLPSWAVIGYWFFFDNVLNALGRIGMAAEGGVAFFAHIGGFVAGVLAVRPFLFGRRRPVRRDAWVGWRGPAERPRALGEWR